MQDHNEDLHREVYLDILFSVDLDHLNQTHDDLQSVDILFEIHLYFYVLLHDPRIYSLLFKIEITSLK